MPEQVWFRDDLGGYMYSPPLSNKLRHVVQPLAKFRQMADVKEPDENQLGLHRGDTYHWNIYEDVQRQGGPIRETERMPETNFRIRQGSLTVEEFGNGVPFTQKLDNLSEQPITSVINQVLKHDAAKAFDIATFSEFDRTPLRVTPALGSDAVSVEVSSDGTPAQINNAPLTKDHVKSISDVMRERNIPPYDAGMDCYVAVTHPTTIRRFKNDLETIHQHTQEGLSLIHYGQTGKYENVVFVEQTHIPKGGAADSTIFDPLSKTADNWDNGQSSWAFFMGDDTVAEGIVVPEEIRGKIPEDYGRGRGIAWYYLGGFGLVHENPNNARVLKWDSLQ